MRTYTSTQIKDIRKQFNAIFNPTRKRDFDALLSEMGWRWDDAYGQLYRWDADHNAYVYKAPAQSKTRVRDLILNMDEI